MVGIHEGPGMAIPPASTSTPLATPSPVDQLPSHWDWPADDTVSVDLSAYYILTYPKKRGLIRTARLVDKTSEEWENPKRVPISYLVKFGQSAIAERLYYRLARTLNVPQQHVFWGMFPGHDNFIASAIRFETEAFLPRGIDPIRGTVTYRRRIIPIANMCDYLRHQVLHRFCGAGDITQVMVRGEELFGIDAANCAFYAQDASSWLLFLEWHRIHHPKSVPVLLEMMHTIAARPDLPNLVAQEVAATSSIQYLADLAATYGPSLHTTHDALVEALATISASKVHT